MTSVSFEVFPPTSPEGLFDLCGVVERLAVAAPRYVSVTYGAGGSSRDRSFATLGALAPTCVPLTAHLTCVGQARAEVEAVLERYRRLGVRRVVALRGDPPDGIDAPYAPHPDGFTSTDELVAAATARRMRVSVSAYPERHPQSPSFDHDLDVLAAKVAAGADEAITQMCFDNEALLRLRDRIASRSIDVSVTAGIFPIHSFPAAERFATRCGASIPPSVGQRFAGRDGDGDRSRWVAAELAAEQIAELRRHGFERFHLYTLNRAALALDVLGRAGLGAPEPAVAAAGD